MQNGLVRGDKVPKEYEDLVEPHVQSMNWFLTEGMQAVVQNMKPIEVCVCVCSSYGHIVGVHGVPCVW